MHEARTTLGPCQENSRLPVMIMKLTDACGVTLRSPGPYTGMNITNMNASSAAQKAAQKALVAVEGMR